jgi:hypothetical protein
MKRMFVRHAHMQQAVASLIAGPQFRVHALDPVILLQQLQLFL